MPTATGAICSPSAGCSRPRTAATPSPPGCRARSSKTRASDFRIEAEPFRGRIGEHDTVEFFIRFDTPLAHGRGYVRLIEGDTGAPQALTVLTTMHELKAFPQATGRNRFREDMRATSRSLENWRDRREAAADFSARDPDVLVIGAGQSGLMMAARLRQMNISTL